MGVLIKSGSSLMGRASADMGVAVVAEVISDGKLAVTGVESFSSLGLLRGMMGSVVELSRT